MITIKELKFEKISIANMKSYSKAAVEYLTENDVEILLHTLGRFNLYIDRENKVCAVFDSDTEKDKYFFKTTNTGLLDIENVIINTNPHNIKGLYFYYNHTNAIKFMKRSLLRYSESKNYSSNNRGYDYFIQAPVMVNYDQSTFCIDLDTKDINAHVMLHDGIATGIFQYSVINENTAINSTYARVVKILKYNLMIKASAYHARATFETKNIDEYINIPSIPFRSETKNSTLSLYESLERYAPSHNVYQSKLSLDLFKFHYSYDFCPDDHHAVTQNPITFLSDKLAPYTVFENINTAPEYTITKINKVKSLGIESMPNIVPINNSFISINSVDIFSIPLSVNTKKDEHDAFIKPYRPLQKAGQALFPNDTTPISGICLKEKKRYIQNIAYALLDITDPKLTGYIDPHFIDYCKANGIINDIICGVPADKTSYIESIKDDKMITILFLRKSALNTKHSIINLHPDLDSLIINTNLLYGFIQVPVRDTFDIDEMLHLFGSAIIDPPVIIYRMYLNINGCASIDQYIKFIGDCIEINKYINRKKVCIDYNCHIEYDTDYTEYRIYDYKNSSDPIKLYKVNANSRDLNTKLDPYYINDDPDFYKKNAEMIELTTSNAVDIVRRWFTDIETL